MTAPPIEPPMNGKRDFVLANTRLIAPPLTPEIRLRLADEAVPIWKKTEDELGAMGLPPPFWAFAWAGGQALARYVLDHADLVKGKRVLDFASGSGLVAIAAAKAGAAEVTASDIDAFAIAAIEANSAENDVAVGPRLDNLIGADEGWEVVLAGDIAYEKDFADAAMDWLASLARRGATVLIGDPRRSYLPLDRLDCVIEYSVPVTRELEDSEIKRTGVFRFSARPRCLASIRPQPRVNFGLALSGTGDRNCWPTACVLIVTLAPRRGGFRCALHTSPSLQPCWRSHPPLSRSRMDRSAARSGQISSTTTTQPSPSAGAGLRPYGGSLRIRASRRLYGRGDAWAGGAGRSAGHASTGGNGHGLRQWSPRARRSLEPHPAGHQLARGGCAPRRGRRYFVGPTDPMIMFESISGTSIVRAASDSSFP